MTLLAEAQFCSNMLRRLFLALYLLVFAALLSSGECRIQSIDRTLAARFSKNVDSKTATKSTDLGTSSICNDDSSEDAELEKARNLENGMRYFDGDAVEEGRGKGKKGSGKLLIYLIGATKATILYVMIHAVAALAGKALIVAKVALAIATAVALKKSLEHNEKTSYEIVKHPYHSYIQTHSSSVDYDHHGDYESGYGHRKRRRIT
ncbi:hypothetical protein KPH14_007601 [Odynerus spinipes]|uniref:Uncharacterized protein n=1 Tax=Odynerus spinipes TaxID=1348599 RepID=A0AAD9RIX3_9HYME|nr:hypothetical protein KPH14_007601 [Odynerus spinipes]